MRLMFVRLLMEHAKLEQSYIKLGAITLESNRNSINLLSKVGFSRIGKIIIDNDLTPVVVFECQL